MPHLNDHKYIEENLEKINAEILLNCSEEANSARGGESYTLQLTPVILQRLRQMIQEILGLYSVRHYLQIVVCIV